MTGRQRQLLTGAVFVGSVAFIFTTIVVGTWSKFWENRDEYTIHFTESVAGMDSGSAIKINGVTVGQVVSIRLDPENLEQVLVEIGIQGGLPIRRDARAVIQSSGITGLKFIEIEPGTNTEELLPPGSRIPTGSSTMTAWTARAKAIAQQFSELQSRLGTVTDDDTRDHVEGIGDELRRLITRIALLAREMNGIIDENRPEIKRTSNNVNKMIASFSKASKELTTASSIIGEDLQQAIATGKAAGESISELTKSGSAAATSTTGLVEDARDSVSRERLNETMATLQTTLQSMTKMVVSLQRTSDVSQEDLAATAEALDDLSQHLGDFSTTLSDNPTSLLRSKGMDEENPE